MGACSWGDIVACPIVGTNITNLIGQQVYGVNLLSVWLVIQDLPQFVRLITCYYGTAVTITTECSRKPYHPVVVTIEIQNQDHNQYSYITKLYNNVNSIITQLLLIFGDQLNSYKRVLVF